jgi:hypothetical protein
MKTHVADWQTRIYCIRIETQNGLYLRYADYPDEVTMSNGTVYRTQNGYEFSGLTNENSMSANSIDLNGILASGAITRADIDSGVYDNARVYLFATSWASPIENEEPLSLLFWGKTTINDDRSYKAELMGLIDVLSQEPSRSYGNMCSYTLFDRNLDGSPVSSRRSRCSGPRAAPDGPNFDLYKIASSVTSVESQYVVYDSFRYEPDDFYGNGAIRFISGKNAGLKPLEIKSYAGGRIEVHEAFSYLPDVNDLYEMIPGCRKRLTEDCVGKWSNGTNFGGFDDIPAPSQYSQVGRN